MSVGACASVVTFPATRVLSRYMREHGYSSPRVNRVWMAGPGWFRLYPAHGQAPTFDVIQRMAGQGYRRIELSFSDARGGEVLADFHVHELLPKTGIAAHSEVEEIGA